MRYEFNVCFSCIVFCLTVLFISTRNSVLKKKNIVAVSFFETELCNYDPSFPLFEILQARTAFLFTFMYVQ